MQIHVALQMRIVVIMEDSKFRILLKQEKAIKGDSYLRFPSLTLVTENNVDIQNGRTQEAYMCLKKYFTFAGLKK